VEVSTRRHRAFDLTTAHGVRKIPRKHTGPYPYTCGSGFFICVEPQPLLDELNHVVFGTVVADRNTVLNMNSVGTRSGIPTKEVKIVDCGQIW
jgi:cyclophilin family peptidyl-prolyl cis-trans isomerase